MTTEAIETSYAGYRFRSRLEARWAVFFDSLRIPWRYEDQGYLIGEEKRPYLPDFWLPEAGAWVEVKGEMERLDLRLLDDAVNFTGGLPRGNAWGELTLLILGPVPAPDRTWTHTMLWRPIWGGECRNFCSCRDLQYRQMAFRGLPLALEQAIGGLPEDGSVKPPGAFLHQIGASTISPHIKDFVTPRADSWTRPDALALDAYRAARSARFEHGESPGLPANASRELTPSGAELRDRLAAILEKTPQGSR